MKELVKVNIIKSAYGVVEEDALELVFDDDSKDYILISEIKNIDLSKKLLQENRKLKEKEELHLNRIDELTDRVVELQAKVKQLESNRDEAIEWVHIVQQDKDNKHLEPIISTDELD